MPFLTKTKSNFNSRKTIKSPMKQGFVPFMKNNRLYEGDWLNDKEHDFGISSIKKGNVFFTKYRGNYYEGKKDGFGNGYFKDGGFYFGNWKKGLRWGFGKMWYTDGSFYGGNWKCDKRHGEGLYVDVDGNRYEGDWKWDERHGIGRLYYLVSGQMQEGAWFKDAAICTTIEDIPFRKTVISPTKYSIREIGLQNSDKVIYKRYIHIHENNSEITLPLRIVNSSIESEILLEKEQLDSCVGT